MKTLKLESLGDKIFFLKSKRLTLLLGTFVPFFVCHIYALTILTLGRKEENEEFLHEKEGLKYSLFLLLGVLVIGLIYLASFSGLNNEKSLLLSKIILVSLLIILICVINLGLTYFYYKVYSEVFVSKHSGTGIG